MDQQQREREERLERLAFLNERAQADHPVRATAPGDVHPLTAFFVVGLVVCAAILAINWMSPSPDAGPRSTPVAQAPQ